MATVRLLIVAVAVLAGGRSLLHMPIRTGLTASVAGVVGQADIHEIAGDHYMNQESSRAKYGSRRRQMLHVRLSKAGI